DEILVLRLRMPLSDPERSAYAYFAEQCLGRHYDYFGTMLHQLIYILTLRRVWIGKNGRQAMKKAYCTELAVHPIHRLRGYFPQPWKTGPSGLIEKAPMYYDVIFEGLFE